MQMRLRGARTNKNTHCDGETPNSVSPCSAYMRPQAAWSIPAAASMSWMLMP